MPDVQIANDARVITIAPDGVLSTGRVLQIFRDHYPTVGDRAVLWDLTRADVSSLSAQDLTAIAVAARSYPRTGIRKTAYVVADAASYLKLCQYLNATATARVPIEYAVFKTMGEARHWIHHA
jgi:hypothetical protein